MPLVLLAVFAASIFVVVGQVGRSEQIADTRSLAKESRQSCLNRCNNIGSASERNKCKADCPQPPPNPNVTPQAPEQLPEGKECKGYRCSCLGKNVCVSASEMSRVGASGCNDYCAKPGKLTPPPPKGASPSKTPTTTGGPTTTTTVTVTQPTTPTPPQETYEECMKDPTATKVECEGLPHATQTPQKTSTPQQTRTPTRTTAPTRTITATRTPTRTPTVAPTTSARLCGNGKCEPGESNFTCAKDCKGSVFTLTPTPTVSLQSCGKDFVNPSSQNSFLSLDKLFGCITDVGKSALGRSPSPTPAVPTISFVNLSGPTIKPGTSGTPKGQPTSTKGISPSPQAGKPSLTGTPTPVPPGEWCDTWLRSNQCDSCALGSSGGLGLRKCNTPTGAPFGPPTRPPTTGTPTKTPTPKKPTIAATRTPTPPVVVTPYADETCPPGYTRQSSGRGLGEVKCIAPTTPGAPIAGGGTPPLATPKPVLPSGPPAILEELKQGSLSCGNIEAGAVVLGPKHHIYGCDGTTGLYKDLTPFGVTDDYLTDRYIPDWYEGSKTQQAAQSVPFEYAQEQARKEAGITRPTVTCEGGYSEGTVVIGNVVEGKDHYYACGIGKNGDPAWIDCTGQAYCAPDISNIPAYAKKQVDSCTQASLDEGSCILDGGTYYVITDPRLAEAYKKKQKALADAQTNYDDCMEKPNADATKCQAEALKSLGELSDMQEFQLSQSFRSQSSLGTYYEKKEQFERCKRKYPTTYETSCAGYQIAASQAFTQTGGIYGVTTEGVDAGFAAYLQEKYYIDYYNAQISWQKCQAEGRKDCVNPNQILADLKALDSVCGTGTQTCSTIVTARWKETEKTIQKEIAADQKKQQDAIEAIYEATDEKARKKAADAAIAVCVDNGGAPADCKKDINAVVSQIEYRDKVVAAYSSGDPSDKQALCRSMYSGNSVNSRGVTYDPCSAPHIDISITSRLTEGDPLRAQMQYTQGSTDDAALKLLCSACFNAQGKLVPSEKEKFLKAQAAILEEADLLDEADTQIAAMKKYQTEEAAFIAGGGTKEEFAKEQQKALESLSTTLSAGSFERLQTMIEAGTILASDVQKMVEDVQDSCGNWFTGMWKGNNPACTKAKDTLLFAGYDEKTKQDMFAKYPEMPAYQSYLKTTGKKDSDATREQFYEDSLRTLTENRSLLEKSDVIRVDDNGQSNAAAVFDQATRGQLNVMAYAQAYEAQPWYYKAAVGVANVLSFGNVTEVSGYHGDSINATISQNQYRNDNAEAFAAVLASYEDDPVYKAKKAQDPSYTTQEYQHDLLVAAQQKERSAEKLGFLWTNSTKDRLTYGPEAMALLGDDSQWLEQGILNGTVDLNDLNKQLEAIKNNSKLTADQKYAQSSELVKKTMISSLSPNQLDAMVQTSAYNRFLSTSKTYTQDSAAARQAFIDQNVSEYMKCQGQSAWSVSCKDYGIAMGGKYTLADAVTGAHDFTELNKRVNSFGAEANFWTKVNSLTGGDLFTGTKEQNASVADVHQSIEKSLGVKLPGWTDLWIINPLLDVATLPNRLALGVPGRVMNAGLDLFGVPDTYEARGFAHTLSHYSRGGTVAWVKPAGAITMVVAPFIAPYVVAGYAPLAITHTTLNSYFLINSIGGMEKACTSGTYFSTECLMATGNTAMMAAFTYSGARLGDVEFGRAGQGALSRANLANPKAVNNAIAMQSKYSQQALVNAQAFSQATGKAAAGFFTIQAIETCSNPDAATVDCITSLGMAGLTAMSGFGRMAPQIPLGRGLQADLGFAAINAVQLVEGCANPEKKSAEACVAAIGFTIMGIHQAPTAHAATARESSAKGSELPAPDALAKAQAEFNRVIDTNGNVRSGFTPAQAAQAEGNLRLAIGQEAQRLSIEQSAKQLSTKPTFLDQLKSLATGNGRIQYKETALSQELKASYDKLKTAEETYMEAVRAGKTGDELAPLKAQYDRAFAEVAQKNQLVAQEQALYQKPSLFRRMTSVVFDIFRGNGSAKSALAKAIEDATRIGEEYKNASAADKATKQAEYLNALKTVAEKQQALTLTRLSKTQQNIYKQMSEEQRLYTDKQLELVKELAKDAPNQETVRTLSQELATHRGTFDLLAAELAATRTVKGWLADTFGLYGGIEQVARESLGLPKTAAEKKVRQLVASKAELDVAERIVKEYTKNLKGRDTAVVAMQESLTKVSAEFAKIAEKMRLGKPLTGAEQAKWQRSVLDSKEQAALAKNPSGTEKAIEDKYTAIKNSRGMTAAEKSLVDTLKAQEEAIRANTDKSKVPELFEKYNKTLTELQQSISKRLQTAPEAASAELLRLSETLKQIDLLRDANKFFAAGDARSKAKAVALLATKEFTIPETIGGMDKATRDRMEYIIRDTEHRLAVDEKGFRSQRANQADTVLKLLQSDRIAVELTTNGGKTTLVGSTMLRIEMEVFGRKPIFVAEQGKAEAVAAIIKKLVPEGTNIEVVRASDVKGPGSDARADAIENAGILVTEIHERNFIRNDSSGRGENGANVKAASRVSKVLTDNVAVYVDELHLNLDISQQGINPVGEGLERLTSEQTQFAQNTGEILEKLGLIVPGDFSAWGKFGGVDGLEIQTTVAADGSVTTDPRFTTDVYKKALAEVAVREKIPQEVVDAIRENAAELNGLSTDAQGARLREILGEKAGSLSNNRLGDHVSTVLDYIDALNTFAHDMSMEYGSAYKRATDKILAEQSGGPLRETAVPANGGKASFGQTFDSKHMPVMEYLSARAAGQKPNFNNLSATPERAYRSSVADWMADLSAGSAIRALTGNMADAKGVVEVVMNLDTSFSSEAKMKIFGGVDATGKPVAGQLAPARSFQVRTDAEASKMLSKLLESGALDTNSITGKSTNGNLKITLAHKGAWDPIKVFEDQVLNRTVDGKPVVKSKTVFVGANGKDTYYKIGVDANGKLTGVDASGKATDTRVYTSAEIENMFKAGNVKDTIIVYDEGNHTGATILTEDVPNVTFANKETTIGDFIQGVSRGNRGDTLSDQYLIYIDDAATVIDFTKSAKDVVKKATMDKAAFETMQQRADLAQVAAEKVKTTNALNLTVQSASKRPIEDAILLIRGSELATDPVGKQLADWLSDQLLRLGEQGKTRDVRMTHETQTTLEARQAMIVKEVAKWDALFKNPANAKYLEAMKQIMPDIYARMEANRTALAGGASLQYSSSSEALWVGLAKPENNALWIEMKKAIPELGRFDPSRGGDAWRQLFTDPANRRILDKVQEQFPDAYRLFGSDAASKDPVLFAKDLQEFITQHNRSITERQESKYTSADSKVDVKDFVNVSKVLTPAQKIGVAILDTLGRLLPGPLGVPFQNWSASITGKARQNALIEAEELKRREAETNPVIPQSPYDYSTDTSRQALISRGVAIAGTSPVSWTDEQRSQLLAGYVAAYMQDTPNREAVWEDGQNLDRIRQANLKSVRVEKAARSSLRAGDTIAVEDLDGNVISLTLEENMYYSIGTNTKRYKMPIKGGELSFAQQPIRFYENQTADTPLGILRDKLLTRVKDASTGSMISQSAYAPALKEAEKQHSDLLRARETGEAVIAQTRLSKALREDLQLILQAEFERLGYVGPAVDATDMVLFRLTEHALFTVLGDDANRDYIEASRSLKIYAEGRFAKQMDKLNAVEYKKPDGTIDYDAWVAAILQPLLTAVGTTAVPIAPVAPVISEPLLPSGKKATWLRFGSGGRDTNGDLIVGASLDTVMWRAGTQKAAAAAATATDVYGLHVPEDLDNRAYQAEKSGTSDYLTEVGKALGWKFVAGTGWLIPKEQLEKISPDTAKAINAARSAAPAPAAGQTMAPKSGWWKQPTRIFGWNRLQVMLGIVGAAAAVWLGVVGISALVGAISTVSAPTAASTVAWPIIVGIALFAAATIGYSRAPGTPHTAGEILQKVVSWSTGTSLQRGQPWYEYVGQGAALAGRGFVWFTKTSFRLMGPNPWLAGINMLVQESPAYIERYVTNNNWKQTLLTVHDFLFPTFGKPALGNSVAGHNLYKAAKWSFFVGTRLWNPWLLTMDAIRWIDYGMKNPPTNTTKIDAWFVDNGYTGRAGTFFHGIARRIPGFWDAPSYTNLNGFQRFAWATYGKTKAQDRLFTAINATPGRNKGWYRFTRGVLPAPSLFFNLWAITQGGTFNLPMLMTWGGFNVYDVVRATLTPGGWWEFASPDPYGQASAQAIGEIRPSDLTTAALALLTSAEDEAAITNLTDDSVRVAIAAVLYPGVAPSTEQLQFVNANITTVRQYAKDILKIQTIWNRYIQVPDVATTLVERIQQALASGTQDRLILMLADEAVRQFGSMGLEASQQRAIAVQLVRASMDSVRRWESLIAGGAHAVRDPSENTALYDAWVSAVAAKKAGTVTASRAISGDYYITGRQVLGGSAADAAIVFDDSYVSNAHAAVEVRGGKAYLTDLNSTNGTFVNGQRLPSGTSQELKPKQVIELGSIELRYEGIDNQSRAVFTKQSGEAGQAEAQVFIAAPKITKNVLVGRGSQAGYQYNNNPYISEKHLGIFRYSDGKIVIQDLGSNNGTFINGRRIVGAASIKQGDIVQMAAGKSAERLTYEDVVRLLDGKKPVTKQQYKAPIQPDLPKVGIAQRQQREIQSLVQSGALGVRKLSDFRIGSGWKVQTPYEPQYRRRDLIFELTSETSQTVVPPDNKIWNYIIDEQGHIFAARGRHPSITKAEMGVKHIQAAAEAEAQYGTGVVKSGQLWRDGSGQLWVDLMSGTYSDYGNGRWGAQWAQTPENVAQIKQFFENLLGETVTVATGANGRHLPSYELFGEPANSHLWRLNTGTNSWEYVGPVMYKGKVVPQNALPAVQRGRPISVGESALELIQKAPIVAAGEFIQDQIMSLNPESEGAVTTALGKIAQLEQDSGQNAIFSQFFGDPFWQNYGLAKGYYLLHVADAVNYPLAIEGGKLTNASKQAIEGWYAKQKELRRDLALSQVDNLGKLLKDLGITLPLIETNPIHNSVVVYDDKMFDKFYPGEKDVLAFYDERVGLYAIRDSANLTSPRDPEIERIKFLIVAHEAGHDMVRYIGPIMNDDWNEGMATGFMIALLVNQNPGMTWLDAEKEVKAFVSSSYWDNYTLVKESRFGDLLIERGFIKGGAQGAANGFLSFYTDLPKGKLSDIITYEQGAQMLTKAALDAALQQGLIESEEYNLLQKPVTDFFTLNVAADTGELGSPVIFDPATRAVGTGNLLESQFIQIVYTPNRAADGAQLSDQLKAQNAIVTDQATGSILAPAVQFGPTEAIVFVAQTLDAETERALQTVIDKRPSPQTPIVVWFSGDAGKGLEQFTGAPNVSFISGFFQQEIVEALQRKLPRSPLHALRAGGLQSQQASPQLSAEQPANQAQRTNTLLLSVKRIYYRAVRRFQLPNKDRVTREVQEIYDQTQGVGLDQETESNLILPQPLQESLIRLINVGQIHNQRSITEDTDRVFTYALGDQSPTNRNTFILDGLSRLVTGYHNGLSSRGESILAAQYYLVLYDNRFQEKDDRVSNEILNIILPFMLELELHRNEHLTDYKVREAVISINENVSHIMVDLPLWEDLAYIPLIRDVVRGTYGNGLRDQIINDLRMRMPSSSEETTRVLDRTILRAILIDLDQVLQSLTEEAELIDPLELVISMTTYLGEDPNGILTTLLQRYFRVVGNSLGGQYKTQNRFNARLFDYYFYNRITEEPFASSLRQFFGDELYEFLVQEKASGRISNYDFGLIAELVVAQSHKDTMNPTRYFSWIGSENWKMIYFLLWGNRLGRINPQQGSPVQAEQLLSGEARIISSDEFQNTVFHGSYDERFSVNTMQRSIPNAHGGSSTLGYGLYATANQGVAIGYATLRSRQNGGTNSVNTIYLDHARLLDFRNPNSTDNNNANLPVPMALIRGWRDYIETMYPQWIAQGRMHSIDTELELMFRQYIAALDQMTANNAQVKLRDMLYTGSNFGFAPLWAMFFGEYMISIHIDGVIYIEVGEGDFKQSDDTIVIYNLAKAGTDADWQARGQDISALKPKQNPYIESLIQDPVLARRFAAPVGVSQGYSLRLHTEMVMNQFDRYFGNRPLPGNVDPTLFRWLLALHDSGKPVIDGVGDGRTGSHVITIDIVRKELAQRGYTEKDINFAIALIDEDVIGPYILGRQYKNNVDMNALSEQIRHLAEASGLSIADYFELLTIYYRVDAGAYTKDAGGLIALDYLFEFDHENMELRFNDIVQSWIDELWKNVLGEEATITASATLNDDVAVSQSIIQQLQPAITRAADAAIADQQVLTNGNLMVFMMNTIRQSPEYDRLFSGNAPNIFPDRLDDDLAHTIRAEFSQREIIVVFPDLSQSPNQSIINLTPQPLRVLQRVGEAIVKFLQWIVPESWQARMPFLGRRGIVPGDQIPLNAESTQPVQLEKKGIEQTFSVRKTIDDTSTVHEIVINDVGVPLTVLGKTDPTLVNVTAPQPDQTILYHGSAKPLSVSLDYDTNPDEDRDGSETLGVGLYATDDQNQARLYGKIRSSEGDGFVTPLIPYRASFLDAREGFPQALAKAYISWWFAHKAERQEYINSLSGLTQAIYQNHETEYTHLLTSIYRQIESGELTNPPLRYLLGTIYIPGYSSLNWLGSPSNLAFTTFMREMGIDGVIATEGGDSQEFGNADSYVFWNYSKVGTKEDWIKREQANQPEQLTVFAEQFSPASVYFSQTNTLLSAISDNLRARWQSLMGLFGGAPTQNPFIGGEQNPDEDPSGIAADGDEAVNTGYFAHYFTNPGSLSHPAVRRILQFLSSIVVDAGHIKDLPILPVPEGTVVDEKGNPVSKEALTTHTQRLQTTYGIKQDFVHGSGEIPALRAEGYLPVVIWDADDLFGANDVSMDNGHYLLRQQAGTIYRTLKDRGFDVQIARVSGDKYLVLMRDNELETDDALRTSETGSNPERRAKKALEFRKSAEPIIVASLAKERALYVKAKTMKLLPVTVTFEDPLVSSRVVTVGDVEKRKTLLLTLYRFLEDDLRDIAGIDATDQKLLINLLESKLLDDVLTRDTEEFEGLVNQDIFVYREPNGFIHDANVTGEEVLYRMEFLGKQKQLNTISDDLGDAFLRDRFAKMTSYAKSKGAEKIRVYKRGADIFFALSRADAAKIRTQDLHDILEAPFQLPVKASDLPLDLRQRFGYRAQDILDRYHKIASQPIVAAVAMEANFLSDLTRTDNAPSEDNIAEFEAVMDRLAALAWEDGINQLHARYIVGKATEADWEFLHYYLDPDDKRGILRLLKLGATEAEVLSFRDALAGNRGDQFKELFTTLLGKLNIQPGAQSKPTVVRRRSE